MAFPPSFLDEIRNRLALSALIGRRVKLVRRGREHSGLCPFHNEKSPSFTVNDDKGFFHCFGCGAHGDAIGFEMRISSLSFPEAVERLAAEAGLEVPKATPEERARAAREAGLHEVMERACAFFEAELRGPRGREGLHYLRGRGLDDTAIGNFRLGFAPESRDALKTALMSAEIPETLLVEAGLLKVPEGGGVSRDVFRGRVIFPITDRRGRVIAFGGRILGDGQPKYLNSPDTPLFHKGRVLYNLARAREATKTAKTVMVVEGYMDVIGLDRAGLAYGVAPLGTALTEQQIEELWRLADEPILCFDGDAAGQRAASRAADRALAILKPGHSLRFALLPPSEDPDSLVRKGGAKAMTDLLAKAETLFDVVWRLTVANHRLDTPERRAALERDLSEKARTIADRAVQVQYESMFRQKLRNLFWQSRATTPTRRPNAAKSGQGFAKGGFRNAPMRPPAFAEGAGLSRAVPIEALRSRILLAVVLNHIDVLNKVSENLGLLELPDKALDNLRRELLKHHDGGADLDSTELQCQLRSSGYSEVLDSLLCSDVYIPHGGFARPDTPFEQALAGWEHTFRLFTAKNVESDRARAQTRLAEEMTAENWDYLRALQAQEQEYEDDEGRDYEKTQSD